jgi:hypothetical protein
MYIILFVLILVFTVFYLYQNFAEIAYVKSDIDNKVYMIRRGNDKTQKFLKDSANILAQINKNIEKLIKYIDTNYSSDSSKNYFIKQLKNNYNPYIISEAAIDPRYTTYTVDKEDIHVCLRTRDQNENIYDINTLMYVLIHELAHLCNYSPSGYGIEGHGTGFKNIFKFLIEQAIHIGIYKYVDYSVNPQEYCGLVITSSII